MKVPNHDELAGIDNAKQSLCMIKSLLTEKQNEEEIEQRRELKDAIEIKLREEAMISRVLKEKLVSKELGIEQLQSDLAASVRFQVVLQNEIQRFQNELRCLTKVQALGSSVYFRNRTDHSGERRLASGKGERRSRGSANRVNGG
ncbi:uncharacterized protein [Zea mays]|uniref:uncharacterized protein n=1 Tax=Zea mays TaxID=4577 RepID=UPI0009AA7139|nr:uncharacterized protein LOC103643859 [Zea mays]|eukprot:XP_020402474.1 uncharacterized protein LOC103643859 [Zea mays]